MKIPYVVLPALLMAVANGFSVTRERHSTTTMALNLLPVDRRAALTAAASLGAVLVMPTVAFAVDGYVPQLKDMQQIYCKSPVRAFAPGGIVMFSFATVYLFSHAHF